MAERKLTLCFVSREYPPAPCGGIGTYVRNIVPALARRGHTIHVITEWVPGAQWTESHGAIHVHRLPFRDSRAAEPALHPDLAPRPGCKELFRHRDPASVFSLEAADCLRRLAARTPIDLVEAPEFEAPLFFYQTARLLSCGCPAIPCAVHLHSPSNRCDFFNHEDAHSGFHVYRHQNECASIAMADSLVCPSRFLARETEQRLGLPSGAIRVIPPPLGEIPAARFPGERQRRTILYAGRLERRKGVDVLLEAAVLLLKDYPDLKIRLVGGDTFFAPRRMAMSAWLKQRLPGNAAGAVEFVPAVPREELWKEYRAAAVCCVPSRWEAFGYTCAEAMACGCPVVATRNGGTAEMIEDGQSGLLCDAEDPAALAEALDRVLRMPGAQREEMGRAAQRRIHAVCDDEKNAEARLELYHETIARHSTQPRRVPSLFPFPETPLGAEHPKRAEALRTIRHAGTGTVAVVVPCYNLGQHLDECLHSVLSQTLPAKEIIVVDDGSTDEATIEILRQWEGRAGVRVAHIPNGGLANARNVGFRQTSADYLVFLDADNTLAPACLEKAAWILEAYPEVGAVTPWVKRFGESEEIWTPPHGQFPFLLVENTLSSDAMVRREAFEEAGGFKPCMVYGYEDWEFWISIAERGWALMALPEVLANYRVRKDSMLQSMGSEAHGFLRRTMLELHPDLFARYGAQAALIFEQRYVELRARVEYFRSLPRRPVEALRFAVEKIAAPIRRRLRWRK